MTNNMDYFLEVKKARSIMALTIIANLALGDKSLSHRQLTHIAKAIVERREALYAEAKAQGLVISIYI